MAVGAVEPLVNCGDLGRLGIEYRDDMIDQFVKGLLGNVHVLKSLCAEIAQRRLARAGSRMVL
jgi:hypothetical protein